MQATLLHMKSLNETEISFILLFGASKAIFIDFISKEASSFKRFYLPFENGSNINENNWLLLGVFSPLREGPFSKKYKQKVTKETCLVKNGGKPISCIQSLLSNYSAFSHSHKILHKNYKTTVYRLIGCFLSNLCLAFYKRDISKQCRLRSERGVRSGSALFIYIYKRRNTRASRLYCITRYVNIYCI